MAAPPRPRRVRGDRLAVTAFVLSTRGHLSGLRPGSNRSRPASGRSLTGTGSRPRTVVGYDPLKSEVEFEFTVEASSLEEFHKKLGQITRLLEREGLVEYQDSTASRLAPEGGREAEPVLA